MRLLGGAGGLSSQLPSGCAVGLAGRPPTLAAASAGIFPTKSAEERL